MSKRSKREGRKATFIILNWNGKELLAESIPAVLETIETYGDDYEILIVDNGSTDGSQQFVAKTYPMVRLLALNENRGFSEANNIAARESKHDIIITLNNDAIVERNFLEHLLDPFVDPEVFAVTPTVYRRDKTTLVLGRRVPRFKWGFFWIPLVDQVPKQPCVTLYASGGSSALDKEKFLALGGFDRLTPNWEDVDLGYRAWKRGWKVIYEPRSIVYHDPGSTFDRMYDRFRFTSLDHENRFLFIWKNITDRSLVLQHLLFLPVLLAGSLMTGRAYSFAGFVRATRRLAEIRAKRHRERCFYTRTDRQVLDMLALRHCLGG